MKNTIIVDAEYKYYSCRNIFSQKAEEKNIQRGKEKQF